MTNSARKFGAEFLVNTGTSGYQWESSTAALSNGGFVVSWTDGTLDRGDSSSTGVRAQLYNADGEAIGADFLVNTQTAGQQAQSAVTSLSNGGFAVAWSDGDFSSSNIKSQLFTASGAKIGAEFLVNTQTAGVQDVPTITGLLNGGFVVSWRDSSRTLGDSSGTSIKAQVFTATGSKSGSEFLINTQTVSSQELPAITGLSNGGFVVSWYDRSNTLGDVVGTSIKAQVYGPSGTRVGTEFLVNTETFGFEFTPSVTSLSTGGFVIAWHDDSGTLGDASGRSIKAQIFTNGGTKLGTEFLVNSETAGDQFGAAVAGLPGGDFVVAWVDGSQTLGDASQESIKAQVFTSTGVKIGSEFLVNTVTESFQDQPSITVLADGKFVIGWTDYSNATGDGSAPNVRAQLFELAEDNTAPFGVQLDADSIVENSGDGTIIGVASASDADAGDTLAFSLADDAGGRFAIDAATGALRVADGGRLDRETAASHGIIIVATDAAGASVSQAFAITVIDADDNSVSDAADADPAPDFIGENAALDSLVGITAAASDADATNNTVTYDLADDAGSRFKIDYETGVVTVGLGELIDREAATSYQIIVRATSADGSRSFTAFTIAVADANEFAVTAAVDGDPAVDIVTENAVDGAATGVVATALDADATTNAVTFALVDDAGGRFAIDAATGVVSVADGSRLDHEAAATHAIVVRSISADGSFADAGFNIAIGDTNEAPVIVSNGGGAGAAVTVAENALLVSTVVGSDPDAGAVLTYAITGGADAAQFSIDAASGVLAFVAAPDFEAPGDADGDNSYAVVVGASDGSLFAEQALTVAVTNVAEARSFVGTTGADSFLAASDDNWTVDGLAGNDTLVTAGGADSIVAGGGNDVISTGGGDDVITFRGSTSANGFDLVDGGAGFDTLRALAANTSIGLAGVTGIELVTANGFANVGIVGSSVADRLDFGSATLIGISGIRAGSGNDVVIGTAGNDVISGEAGDDLLQGGDGNDVFRIGTGAGVDGFDGGAGFDSIVATATNARITPSGLSGIEVIDAAGFANVTIYGTAAANIIDLSGIAVTGIAAIVAGSGDDSIIGSAGADTIRGGAGLDMLRGGGGSNVFDYDASSDSKTAGLADVIADFISGVDIIDLSTIDANTTVGANQAFIFIGDDAFSRTAGELRFDTSLAGVTRIFGDTNGNGAADFEIRLTGTIELTVADFIA